MVRIERVSSAEDSGEAEPDSPRLVYHLVDVSRESKKYVLKRFNRISSDEGKGEVVLDSLPGKYDLLVFSTKGSLCLEVLRLKRGAVYVNENKLRENEAVFLKHGDTLQVGSRRNKGCRVFVLQHVPPNASSIDEEMRCGICLETFVDPFAVVPCGHNFCRDCIGSWLETRENLSCPTCNARITVPFAVPNLCLKNLVNTYFPATTVDAERKRKKRSKKTLEAYITPKVLKEGTLRIFRETKCSKYPMCNYRQ